MVLSNVIIQLVMSKTNIVSEVIYVHPNHRNK